MKTKIAVIYYLMRAISVLGIEEIHGPYPKGLSFAIISDAE